MVSVVIPAFNEQETIGAVVASVIGHPDIAEVIVVDDGSTDATAIRAAKAGAVVITMSSNKGKGAAMTAGVHAAKGDVLLFLDADVVGLTGKIISQIIGPVISGKYAMFVGLRDRKVFLFNIILRYSPIIGGERAVLRSLWHNVPLQYRDRFKVEVALNYFSKQTPLGMGVALIDGTTHTIKERKYGLAKGLFRRMLMVRDVVSISISLYFLDFFKKWSR